MTLTLDLNDADLAHIWANATWDGKDPKPMPAILEGILRDYAGRHRAYLKTHAAETRQDFHELEEETLTRFREAVVVPESPPCLCAHCCGVAQ